MSLKNADQKVQPMTRNYSKNVKKRTFSGDLSYFS